MKTLKALLAVGMVVALASFAFAASVTINHAGGTLNGSLTSMNLDQNGNVTINVPENLGTGGGGGGSDTQAPSVPTNLQATAVSSSQINLSWNASDDDVGVTSYRIYRGGQLLTSTSSTSYSNTGLSASTQYTYTVSARDAALNESAQSSPASATTQASGGGGGGGGNCIDMGGSYPNYLNNQQIPALSAVTFCFTISKASVSNISAYLSSRDWSTNSDAFLSPTGPVSTDLINQIIGSRLLFNATVGSPPWYNRTADSNERAYVYGYSARQGDKFYVTVYNNSTVTSLIMIYWTSN